MIRRIFSLGFFFLVLAFSAFPALAHEIRPAIFELTFNEDNSFQLTASANLEAIIADIGSEHDDTNESPNASRYEALRRLPSSRLEQEFRKTSTEWLSNLGLTIDGEPAQLALTDISISDVGDVDLARISELTMTGTIPADAKVLVWAYAPRYGASILRINRPGEEQFAQFFNAGANSGPMKLVQAEKRTFWSTVSYYVYQGFIHIIPEGLDHILFVLGLFLLCRSLRPLLWQVTAFTAAHTITLALGGSGIVNLPGSVVEPLIALSIVYVAVENILTDKLHVWRPLIVFGFGLLHGLGFAGVMADVGLPDDYFATGLIAFNVGVELGQLTVIAIAFALVGWFMRKSWYRRLIVIPASLAIAAMGAFWFFERTML